MFARWLNNAGVNRLITRSIDNDSGMIVVTARGRWSRVDVEEHFTALRELIRPIRKRGNVVRILSDVRQAERQTADIEAQILEDLQRTYAAGDRIAILAANADLQTHLRQLLWQVEVSAFQSRLPAEMWLLTDDLPTIR